MSQAQGAPRRRRVLKDKPSLLACDRCRRSRIKCVGSPRIPCDQCGNHGLVCQYSPHVKLQKNEILAALTEKGDYLEQLRKENEELSKAVQSTTEELAKRAERDAAEEYSSIITTEQHIAKVRDVVKLESCHKIKRPMDHGRLSEHWKVGIDDIELGDHFVHLFFTTVHPRFLSINEVAFIDSYLGGSSTACSASLLNVVCALGCKSMVSSLSPNSDATASILYLYTRFVSEAQNSISSASSTDMTQVQSMTLMSLVALSECKAQSSIFYLQSAIEMICELIIARGKAWIQEDTTVLWIVRTLSGLWLLYNTHNPFPVDIIETCLTFVAHGYSAQKPVDPAVSSHWISVDENDFWQLLGQVEAHTCQITKRLWNTYLGHDGLVTPNMVRNFIIEYRSVTDILPRKISSQSFRHFVGNARPICIHYYGMLLVLWQPLVEHARDQKNWALYDHFKSSLLKVSQRALTEMRAALVDQHVKRWLPPDVVRVVLLCDSHVQYATSNDERKLALDTCHSFLSQNSFNPVLCRVLSRSFHAETSKVIDQSLAELMQQTYNISITHVQEETFESVGRPKYGIPTQLLRNSFSPDFLSSWLDNALSPYEWDAFDAEKVWHPMRIKDICGV